MSQLTQNNFWSHRLPVCALTCQFHWNWCLNQIKPKLAWFKIIKSVYTSLCKNLKLSWSKNLSKPHNLYYKYSLFTWSNSERRYSSNEKVGIQIFKHRSKKKFTTIKCSKIQKNMVFVPELLHFQDCFGEQRHRGMKFLQNRQNETKACSSQGNCIPAMLHELNSGSVDWMIG